MEGMLMKYSFIVPTYNSDRWIQPCIRSILAQTYTGFDIIVLDSGSTDGTLQWISNLNDSRIRIYTTSKRLGIVENWQRATSVPRNEFMTIMGHDDILYPEYLNTIDELVARFPDAALYQTHFNFIAAKGAVIRAGRPMKTRITPSEFLEGVLTNTIEIIATGFMVRSAAYDAIGGIPPYPQLLYADTELWLQLILNSYLAVAPEICFEFRFHVDNTSKSAGWVRLIAFEKMINFLQQLEQGNAGYRSIIERHARAYLKSYVTGACHKLIYIPKAGRGDASMDSIIASAKMAAQKILPGEDFRPDQFPGVLLAKMIDANSILRRLFLFYKSFKKRTF